MKVYLVADFYLKKISIHILIILLSVTYTLLNYKCSGEIMIYRISHSIIYTPDDGSIKLISDDPSYFSTGEITLAPTANRLLSLLIAHHGSILQRDELLEQVWDAHGLKASNNSLNQYVSMLRRNFADLGIEEVVIVTIPTVGFMFSKDIDVTIESSLPIEPSTAEIAAPEIITDTGEALSTAAPQSKAVVKISGRSSS